MSYTCDAAHDGRTYQIEIPEIDIPKCQACGTLVITNSVDDRIIQTLRARVGLLTPEQIRNGREALGLKSKELAEKLGVAAETISRWESGGLIQSRAMDNFLRVYFAVPEARAVLRGAEQDRNLGTTITEDAETLKEDRGMNATTLDVFTPHYTERAEQLFLRPGAQYGWDEIVAGVDVQREHEPPERMFAVDPKTFRGFHLINKTLPGAKKTFQGFFIGNRDRLVTELLAIADRDGLHQLSNRVSTEIRLGLTNISPNQLTSYNKVRKPVDLYLEHLVAMSCELEKRRHLLVPLLFLPLDSQMLGCRALFTERELAEHHLRRTSTYSEVRTEAAYLSLQEIVARQAGEVSRRIEKSFSPIYFDLLWNNRYSNWGSNLFEANPLKNRRCG